MQQRIEEGVTTFGRLTVVALHGVDKRKRSKIWLCRCECGNELPVRRDRLTTGNTRSCGCLQKEVAAETMRKAVTTHGRSDTFEYRVWHEMNRRCVDDARKTWANYGGRGITVCDRWRESFENFLADMGEAPSDSHSIDRRDNEKGYGPDNCRWATGLEQAANKRNNRVLTFNGKTQHLAAWSRETGIKAITIHRRLQLGWPVERALTTPVAKQEDMTDTGGP